MAKFKCPSPTCNVVIEGAIFEIVNPAIWHAEGSHRVNATEEDIVRIISEQANGVGVNSFIDESIPKIDIKKWWNKINR